MRAWLIAQQTGLDQLRLGDAPAPVPQAGEVVLQLNYAALNPADRYLAEAQYPAHPSLPHILGRDGVGTIVQLGAGVSGHALGERRAILHGEAGASRPGTFAERVAVPASHLVAVPTGWSEAQAAAAPLVYLTAYQALTQWGPLPTASVVLVTGASGGVGVASVQLAAAMGHTVVALSRSADKCRRLRPLGADFTFDPADKQWFLAAKATLQPRRVALAIDNIGGPLLPQVIGLLGDQGCVSLVGRLGGPVPEFNTATLFFHRLRLGGVAVGSYSAAEAHAAWEKILALLNSAGTRPLVDSVFPFEELPKAFARLQEGPMGKVLIQGL